MATWLNDSLGWHVDSGAAPCSGDGHPLGVSMRHLKSALAVIGAVVILVLAGNTIAIAANGKGFLIGKINSGTKITTLKRTTAGTALKIQTKSATNSPLQVNGSGKVANLNADKVDGLDSSTMLNKSWTYTIPTQSGVGSFAVAFPTLPKGKYLATFTYGGSMSAATSVNCGIKIDGSYSSVFSYGGLGGGFSVASGAGVIDTNGHTVGFGCFDWTGTFSSSGTNQVSFTQVNSIANGGTASGARTLPSARNGANG